MNRKELNTISKNLKAKQFRECWCVIRLCSSLAFFFWLYSSAAYAQTGQPANPLDAVITHRKEDTAQVNELLKLSFQHLYNDSLKSRYYALKALNLSEKLQYRFGEACGWTRLGDVYHQSGQYKEVYAAYQKAVAIGNKYKETQALCIVYNELGLFYSSLQESDKALEYFQKSLLLIPLSNQQAICNKYLNIGMTYGAAGDTKKALEYLEKALAIALRTNSSKDLAFIYHNIGNVYKEQKEKDFDRAIEYYMLSLKASIDSKNLKLEASNYTMLSDIYMQQGMLQPALQFVQQAIDVSGKAGFTPILINSRILLYDIQSKLHLFRESETGLQQLQDSGSLNMEQRKYMLEAFLDLFREKGEYSKALNYAVLLAAAKDSIAILSNKKNMDLLEVRFETKEQEKEINLLKQENKWKTILLYLGGIGVLLSTGIIVLLFYSRRLKEKVFEQREKMLQEENNKILAEKALMEEKALREKEKLNHKNRELSASVIQADQMNRILSDIKEKLSGQDKLNNTTNMEDVQRLIRHNLRLSDNWHKFKLHFEEVHPAFFDKLIGLSPGLSQNELKHCAYIRMNMSNKQVASLLNVHPDSVKMSRYRIKKKFGLSPEDDLTRYILSL
ncbi:tetratricopeptide repeat protein [Chitinophaga sp.]|uniref:tetratricopeptide repeat protein n=1 Tax=Chitinophaga sp. TaxID=1869181 RepID=UPI002BEE4B79|nr:tetratricopeptide repeat protein [Chitinophaga sp.]HWV66915.1 tetratricopeptide repeat protein [Chitinophaga sp.]